MIYISTKSINTRWLSIRAARAKCNWRSQPKNSPVPRNAAITVKRLSSAHTHTHINECAHVLRSGSYVYSSARMAGPGMEGLQTTSQISRTCHFDAHSPTHPLTLTRTHTRTRTDRVRAPVRTDCCCPWARLVVGSAAGALCVHARWFAPRTRGPAR